MSAKRPPMDYQGKKRIELFMQKCKNEDVTFNTFPELTEALNKEYGSDYLTHAVYKAVCAEFEDLRSVVMVRKPKSAGRDVDGLRQRVSRVEAELTRMQTWMQALKDLVTTGKPVQQDFTHEN